MTATPQFAILCICTGNVCRSPAAERLLAHALGSSVTVSSTGTYALVGQSFSPPMDHLVRDWGADPGGFEAQQLSVTHLHQADLVLGMTREHRSAAVDLVPQVVRRSFTLREYARLLGQIDPDLLPAGSPAERARASLPLAAARRRRAGATEDDVADPYRQPDAAYAQAFAGIEQAVRSIAAVLNGVGQRSGCAAM